MRKYLLGIVAFALAISISAFTTKSTARPNKKNKKMVDDVWYLYVGPDQAPGSRSTASYYQYASGGVNCGGGSNECAVQLDNVITPIQTNPDFTYVTFNGTTGKPQGGNDFSANAEKQ